MSSNVEGELFDPWEGEWWVQHELQTLFPGGPIVVMVASINLCKSLLFITPYDEELAK